MLRSVRKLVDACVWLALLNKKDKFHERSLIFLKNVHEGNNVQIVIPSHTMIEVNIKLKKIKKTGKWDGVSPFEAVGPEFYPIDVEFIRKTQKLYDWLGELGSQDAIYAAIAYLENIPLVTFDEGFKKVNDKIILEFI